MVPEPVSNDPIDHIMRSVGLIVSFDSEGFLSLDPGQQAEVRRAVDRYHEIVGPPSDKRSSLGFGMSHRPGSKSALFRRLLSGKEPFPVPPPTSYSYPWYSLLDLPGPRKVSLGGFGTVASAIRAVAVFSAEESKPEGLMINQDAWIVVRANEAARLCMSSFDIDGHESATILAAAKEAEWVVRHPGAPRHRVYWGSDGVLQEGHIEGLIPSLRMGEFEVTRVLRSSEEDMLDQQRNRDAALAAEPAESGPPSPARAIARRSLEHFARPDWRPIDRGPLVEYRHWTWMIAPMDCA